MSRSRDAMMAVLTLAALSAPVPLSAQGHTDPMRCEARRMRCDSKQFECLVRCAGGATGSTDTPTTKQSACKQACEKHAKQVMDRIERNPPCASGPIVGVPDTCEARVLRIGAASLVCASRCADQAQGHDAFDLDGCRQACQDRCNTSLADMLASPVCSDGRVGTDAVCSAQ